MFTSFHHCTHVPSRRRASIVTLATALAACGRAAARRPARRPRRRRRPPAVDDRHAAGEADRAGVGFHRDRAIAALDDGPAAGRRARHEDLRQVGRRVRARRRRCVQIDPEKQAATVRNTESQRAAREADVTYWKAQVERLKSLLEAGAISQNEFDTAQHNLDTRAGEPGRARRAGARGPRAAAVLPRHRADGRRRRRHPGARRRSRHDLDGDHDDRRQEPGSRPTSRCRSIARPSCASACRCRSSTPTARWSRPIPITFVAPRVDRATQTVLAKSAAARSAAGDTSPAVREDRGSIWRSEPGLTVPVTAVTQHQRPVFLLRRRERSATGPRRARQRPGAASATCIGNDYVVTRAA